MIYLNIESIITTQIKKNSENVLPYKEKRLILPTVLI